MSASFLTPDVVTCELLDPTATTSTPEVTFDAELATPDGVLAPGYYVEVDVETPGTWYYRFAATGAGQAANEGSFYVEISNFAG